MGLFGELLGGLEAGAGQHAALYEEIAGLVTQSGGVNGLIQQFEQQGLGQQVSSGANTPISADQILQVIGQDRITTMAARVGLSEPQVAEGIGKILPVVIAHLSSSGPAAAAGGGQFEAEALGLLKAKLFGG